MSGERPIGAAQIRAARPDDVARMREIEVSAGAIFRDVGMAEIAEDEPPPADVLLGHVDAGRAWVAVGPDDRPAAYLLVDVVDDAAHVEQVSVDQAHRGERLGTRLVETAAEWARERGCARVTLTTFAEVPWNAPYYQRLGFTVLADDALGPGLAAVRRREAALGLDRWPRIAMELRLLEL